MKIMQRSIRIVCCSFSYRKLLFFFSSKFGCEFFYYKHNRNHPILWLVYMQIALIVCNQFGFGYLFILRETNGKPFFFLFRFSIKPLKSNFKEVPIIQLRFKYRFTFNEYTHIKKKDVN